jgi:hypothetical protein
MPAPLDVRDPKRAAHAAVAGYHYQFVYTALQWLECDEETTLYCEGNEDLDAVLRDGNVIEAQVKHVKTQLGQGSAETRALLARFASAFIVHHRQGRQSRFVFHTTSKLGGRRDSVLAKWMLAKPFAPASLQRHFQKLAELSPEDKSYLTHNALWAEVFSSVRWAFCMPDLERYESELANRLGSDSRLQGLSPEKAQSAMLAHILSCAGKPSFADRSLSALQLEILFSDLWLETRVDDYGADSGVAAVYFARAQVETGEACVALLLDDQAKTESEFNLACRDVENQPQGVVIHDLVELASFPQGLKFLSGAQFDAYAVVRTINFANSAVGELSGQLIQYLVGRGVSSVNTDLPRLIRHTQGRDGETVDACVAASDCLGMQLARYVCLNVLSSWSSKVFSAGTLRIHRKLRVIADLDQREYFTQDHPPPWGLSP